MKIKLQRNQAKKKSGQSLSLDRKLASYLAASATIGAVVASDAKAIIISNSVTQQVGINGVANIDFNSDGQTDFQIDHDHVNIGTLADPHFVDYLQIDKNDINGQNNPLDFDPLTDYQAATFSAVGTTPNDANNAAYLVASNPAGGGTVEFPAKLIAGAQVGPSQFFDFQEGESIYSSGKTGHLNRLIDGDHGQIDMVLGGKTAAQIFTPANTPQFVGSVGATRYLGIKMELNNSGQTNYGWIGIKVTDDAQATADVVGYGYQTQAGVSILSGDTGARAGDYNNDGKVDAADYVLWRKGGALQNETVTPGSNTPEDYTPWRINFGATLSSGFGTSLGSETAVPEPGSAMLSLISGLGLVLVYLCRRIRGKS